MAISALHRLIKFNQISPFSDNEGSKFEEAETTLHHRWPSFTDTRSWRRERPRAGPLTLNLIPSSEIERPMNITVLIQTLGCEMKIHILWQGMKNLNIEIFSAFWPPLSPHCGLCIFLMYQSNLPIGRNTCSTIKKEQHSPSTIKMAP